MGDAERFRRQFQRLITRFSKRADHDLLLAMEEECQQAAQMLRRTRCGDEPCD